MKANRKECVKENVTYGLSGPPCHLTCQECKSRGDLFTVGAQQRNKQAEVHKF